MSSSHLSTSTASDVQPNHATIGPTTPPLKQTRYEANNERGLRRPGQDDSGSSCSALVEALANQFQQQGIRMAPKSGVLWCALCTTRRATAAGSAARELKKKNKNENYVTPTSGQLHPTRREGNRSNSASSSSSSDDECGDGQDVSARGGDAELLAIVGRTRADILAHCGTREHLLNYEADRESGLQQWCPAEIHGQRMLLDHHCVYPRHMFGPGRVLMDETINNGTIIAEDVCGGVKLWPRHKYVVTELVLQTAETATREIVLGEEDAKTKGPAKADACKRVRLFHEVSSFPENVREQCESFCGRTRKTKHRFGSAHTVLTSFTTGDREVGAVAKGFETMTTDAMLREVNRCLQAEMAHQQRRRERFAKLNFDTQP